ncbi:MAG: peptidoglycan editing factor PgeF [Alphaproteobacteria bacterium]|nr:peptidoglycan editing factor PgeF [Alphaproteobacteria bacterium]
MPVLPRFAHAGRILDAGGPPRFKSAALAAMSGVRHGFFGREGGVSKGLYASLNAGAGSNDDPAAVAENRARIAAALQAAPEALISVHQVHSATAVRVDAPWSSERPKADAMVTATPGLALAILTADCAPVLLADAQAQIIGAAHAGWKGALSGVLEATIDAMQAAGAETQRITAAIGPCIRQPSYEVGSEFEELFMAADPGAAPFFRAGRWDRRQFDLPGYCVQRLTRAGVTRIDSLALDTYSDPVAFFSHRRSVHEKAGDYGRNCAAIMLAP